MIWDTSSAERPDNLRYLPDELTEIVVITRLNRYNRGLPCGTAAIRRQLQDLDIRPLPSESFISRVLRQYCLTYRRTGKY